MFNMKMKTMTHIKAAPRFQSATIAVACGLALSACGGGGDDSANDPNNNNGTGTVSVAGVLVQPLDLSSSGGNPACTQVPDGYAPLGNLSVTFNDSTGATISTVVTDQCGKFSGNVPQSATFSAQPSGGLNPISQPVTSLVQVTSGSPATLISTTPAGSTYQISVVQYLGNGDIGISVTDDKTNKAVLGLVASNIQVAIGSIPQSVASFSYGATTAKNASIALVMDASGSMGGDPIRIASKAGHVLLDGLQSGADEAGVVIFDDSIVKIDDTALAKLTWTQNGASSSPYQFSASGLTTDLAKLRPIIDLYNRSSQIYSSSNQDPVNPATGNWRLASSYPWGGSTAFYTATQTGINLLDQAKNTRRIVVAMTDGMDNSSYPNTADSAIALANSKGIPLYTVAFGVSASVDEKTMQRMASETGGEYKRVEGTDLTGLFQSIQTGITHQYVAHLSTAPASGSTLSITVTPSGATPVSRSLTIN